MTHIKTHNLFFRSAFQSAGFLLLTFSFVFFASVLLLSPSRALSAVVNGFEIKINVPARRLKLLYNGSLIKEYPVGVGYSSQQMTPPGDYEVDTKVINPIWEHPFKKAGESRVSDPALNPLGSRWIGFHKEGSGFYGIHGTNELSSVGKFVSHGCVRMRNEDVEDLFETVPIGTPVKVLYERFELKRSGEMLLMEIFPDPYKMKKLDESEILNEVGNRVYAISPLLIADINAEELADAMSDGGYTGRKYEIARLRQNTGYRQQQDFLSGISQNNYHNNSFNYLQNYNNAYDPYYLQKFANYRPQYYTNVYTPTQRGVMIQKEAVQPPMNHPYAYKSY